MTGISIVVPTYNENGNVVPFVNQVEKVLHGSSYEIIFVDDDSPDGTSELVRSLSQENPRIRLISRVGRRGLSGACIEGFSCAIYETIVVTDADMQHDLNAIPTLCKKIDEGFDLVLGTRYGESNESTTDFKDFNLVRGRMSEFATIISKKLCRVTVSDPMSGFFAVKRNSIHKNLIKYNNEGFKILLDILITDPDLKVGEVPYKFKPRQHGESKLDSKVMIDFFTLLLSGAVSKRISPRLMLFYLIGGFGLLLHLVFVNLLLTFESAFWVAQLISTVAIIYINFYLNNTITYSDQRLSDLGFYFGLYKFYAISSVGVLANLGFSNYLFDNGNVWFVSALCGALIGATWNYFLSMYLVWSKK